MKNFGEQQATPHKTKVIYRRRRGLREPLPALRARGLGPGPEPVGFEPAHRRGLDSALRRAHRHRGRARGAHRPRGTPGRRLQPLARDAGRDPIAAARSVAERGRSMLPARLRGDVRWAAIGGVLGALACVGATVAAPAAAVALPAWAMSGAGLGGVLGLLRKTPSTAEGDGDHNGTNTDLELGESVLAATLLAVLLWKQGEGEQAVEAALLAARKSKQMVEMADFDEALDRIVGGLEKKNRVMNPKEKETIAFHEAGHAIVAEHRPLADRVSKVSIIPRGVAALGYTQQTPTEDRYLLKRSELLDRLDVLLGGRIAEQLIFGDVSTGAQNDLQRATDMARQMITQFGMSDQLGLATYENMPNPLFAGTGLMQRERNEYSESTAQMIDAEVRKLLAEASHRVQATLEGQRTKLDALAQLLLEKEVVDRQDLDMFLSAKVTPMPPPKPVANIEESTATGKPDQKTQGT